jgi:anti-sigma factor RsiW
MVTVAELRNVERPDTWLRKELARQLGPVPAPESLWQRIHEQRRPLRVPPVRWAVWSAATVALLALSAGVVREFAMTRDPVPDLVRLTEREVREFADGSGRMDFHSDDPGEVRTWVKTASGIDIELRDCLPPGKETVRLLGARLIRLEGLPVAAITYRVGEDFAAMLVTGRRAVFGAAGKPGHGSPRIKSSGGVQSFSWNMGAHMYAIALVGPADPQRACLLCHVSLRGPIASH